MTTSEKSRIFTVPNILSLLRIALIPAFVALYMARHPLGCAALLLLSGATDLLDGWYARRFGAVSDAGKILDPVADKLTLLAALAMLLSFHPGLLVLLALLVLREAMMALTGMLAIARSGNVPGARWHGKATTALMYLTLFMHILWQDIPRAASNISIVICCLMMLFSAAMYVTDNCRRIRYGRGDT